MIEVADIFRQYGVAYRAKYAVQIPPIHLQVLQAIEDCRTPVLGGHVYYCPDCDETVYRYHSCRNRHCPKCQGERAYRWLGQQQELLLPVPYCMLTFTLPDELVQVARSHPSIFYDLLFRASAQATQKLARDPRFIGGQVGMVGVLHTWGRSLVLHPHVHYLLPNGGLAKDGTWRPGRGDFFLPVKALSILFKAKFRDALRKTDYFDLVPPDVWQKDWVVHCMPVGDGSQALKYLAPYIFRVAISNSRIVSLENDQVTFRYRDTKTGKTKYCTLDAQEFIRRFLQHVLPEGFVKVRYYGFLAPGCRKKLAALRQSLGLSPTTPPHSAADQVDTPPDDAQANELTPKPATYHPDGQPEPDNDRSKPCCPKCGRVMQLQATIPPQGRCPP